MYRSILVPLDGSPFGEHALPLALSLAQRSGAKLEIARVHVSLTPMYAETVLAFDNVIDEAEQRRERVYLDTMVRRLTAIAPISVTASLLQGPIAEALENRAAALGADLLVSTTHGRGPVARSWLGSVADELVRRMPIPLLLIRPHEVHLDLADAPSLKHIFILLDGSEMAEHIIQPAMNLGDVVKSDFTLLRIIRPAVLGNYELTDPLVGPYSQTVFSHLQALHDEERKHANEYLERIAQQFRARSLPVQTRVLSHEQPTVAILDEVKAHHADLVALETHGRSGLPRLFLGSVADKVLRGSSVPILIQRPTPKK
jgi:nucleotide-binding universal stress UspA family protein